MGLVLAGTLLSCQSDLIEDQKLLETDSRSLTVSESVIITFDKETEGFMAGDIVSSTSPEGCGGAVGVFAENPDFPGENAAMIFDSSNPTGEDEDLGTPNNEYGGPGVSEDGPQESNQDAQGNVLIITEDFDSEDPDDSFIEGSYYEFDFSAYGNGFVTMESFLMIDLDGESKGDGTVVKLYDGDENELYSKEIMPMEDNGVQTVDLENTEGVVKMVLYLNNSGAIDDIRFKCDREIKEMKCETMFAKGSDGRCFADTEPYSFQRWGWTNAIEEGFDDKLELWAGAGQCKTEKGTLVGYLHVSYTDGTLTAKYEMMNGYYMKETHFYAGSDMYPYKKNGSPTVAPGQYPYKNEMLDYATSDEYTVEGLEGMVYLIAHGEVCGEFYDDKGYDDDDDYDDEYEEDDDDDDDSEDD